MAPLVLSSLRSHVSTTVISGVWQTGPLAWLRLVQTRFTAWDALQPPPGSFLLEHIKVYGGWCPVYSSFDFS